MIISALSIVLTELMSNSAVVALLMPVVLGMCTALGLEPRAPHPQGYEMGADDWSLLDPVRRRPRFRSSE